MIEPQALGAIQIIRDTLGGRVCVEQCHMGEEGGLKSVKKSVTYYLNGPLVMGLNPSSTQYK